MKGVNSKFLASGIGISTAFVLCVVYIFASVLKDPLLSDTPVIEVEMSRTGGLFQGSLATYRGVRIGKVKSIELADEGVVAVVELTAEQQVPRDSKVQVRSLSPVGEQYLDFQPRSTEGPYLEDGDTIPASAIDLPETLGAVAITLNELIEQIDPDKLRTVLDEVSTGLVGTEDDLRRLLEDGSSMLRQLDRYWPVTQRLLRNGRTVLSIGADGAADLARLARSAKVFAAWLRANDPTLFRLLRRAPGQIEDLRGLVRDMAQTLPELLDPSVTLTDILAARDPHLRELLVRFPQGFQTLAGAIRGGRAHLDAIMQRTRTCNYSTPERSPRDASNRPLQDDGRCSTSLTYSQRGAQWAPPPLR